MNPPTHSIEPWKPEPERIEILFATRRTGDHSWYAFTLGILDNGYCETASGPDLDLCIYCLRHALAHRHQGKLIVMRNATPVTIPKVHII